MHYAVLDLEIKRPVEHKADWALARKGAKGISIAVVYDSLADRLFYYDEHTLEELVEHLESVDVVVTFNGQDFDIPCIEGLFGDTLDLEEHIDLLQEIWRALRGKYTGYRLGDVAHRTLGLSKTGKGERAPDLYHDLRLAELVQYCADDVVLTDTLFNYIRTHGHIIDVDGNKLEVDLE